MELELLAEQGPARRREAEELLALNRPDRDGGLRLTPQDALALTRQRDKALRAAGRLEFGGGMLIKLVLAFQDSPYLPPGDPVDTLGELAEVFYYFKNEMADRLTDDELLEAMRASFDGPCGGSVELLAGRNLEALARLVREGRAEKEEADEDGDEWN